MTRRQKCFGAGRKALPLFTAFCALAGATLVGAAPADAATAGTRIVPGVVYKQFDIEGAKGLTHAHVLSIDLTNRHVSLGLLYPGAVAARATVSTLADTQKAVAGINGDFFNIAETQHPGVTPTGASVGPAIANGRALKGAVPDGQRFGPEPPSGTTTEAVVGVGTDGRARLDSLHLQGSVRTLARRLPLGGLNQYALPVGSIGAYTSAWGSVSRVRAICGTDTDRAAACSTDAYEVTVRRDRVVSVAGSPGSGAIARGDTVLVGREAGARQLRRFAKGRRVSITHGLVSSSKTSYRFALGGHPVLRGGQPLPGLDGTTSAVRTAVGIANSGKRVLLFALDGASAYRSGLTIAEVAAQLKKLGAAEAFGLDGGGSTTLVARPSGSAEVTVRNHPSGGAERPVPNGIGVFYTR